MRLTVKRVVELLTVYPDRLWRKRPVLSHIVRGALPLAIVSYRSQLFQEFPKPEEKDIRQAPETMRLETKYGLYRSINLEYSLTAKS